VGLHRQLGGWLRSSHSFKECVIAHQSSGPAPKMVGTCKHATEATDGNYVFMVGERSQGREVVLEGAVERWEVKMPE
jgi:hypothetical protein